jgi:hypothetical protein
MNNCITFADGYRYQLRAGYAVFLPELADPSRPPIRTPWVELDPDGWLRIRPGYAWDGPSGPTMDTKTAMRGSLVHDVLFQLLRLGHLPPSAFEPANRILQRICLEDGMWSVRANLWYHAVRIFAKPATDPAAESPDQCAPEGCCK